MKDSRKTSPAVHSSSPAIHISPPAVHPAVHFSLPVSHISHDVAVLPKPAMRPDLAAYFLGSTIISGASANVTTVLVRFMFF